LVSCGYFTSPELQYMLVKDRRYLEYGEGIEDDIMRQFLMEKHFTFKDTKDVFSSYGYVRSKRVIYDRVGYFSQPLLKIKVGGRLVFILPEDVTLFVSAYRKEFPKDEAEILEYIRDNPGLKKKEITEACKSDFTRLEDNLYVYRDEENRFYALDAEVQNKSEAQREIVSQYITSCGPVSKEEILYYTRFQREDLDSILCDFKTVTVFSKIVQEMYCTEEDYTALKMYTSKKSTLKIIDRSDPFYDKVQHDSHMGELFSPLLKNGRIVGGILFGISDTFSVEEFTFSEEVSAAELFPEIERVYNFYRWHGVRALEIKPEPLRKMAESLSYTLEDGILMDAPAFKGSPQDVYYTQVKNQHVLEPAGADEVLKLPFLDREAAQKRITEPLQDLIKTGTITEVTYNNRTYLCLPEDRKMYDDNNIHQMIDRLLTFYVILSPFEVKELVQAELYEIEPILSSLSQKVYYKGEAHYKRGDLVTPDEHAILFLPVTDPYVLIHKREWSLEGTGIFINGEPAGYYTLEDNLADLTLYKEFKDFWGNILVKLPSESVAIRTINGRPVKDTRFARAFS